MKKIVVTGAAGFIGKNLCLRLKELARFEVVQIEVDTAYAELVGAVAGADAIAHLAGVNRPPDPTEFMSGNLGSITDVVHGVEENKSQTQIIMTSSARAEDDTPYGQSKKAAENALLDFATRNRSPVHIFRLTNVFGKWCRPNYNSAVATFCYNIARDLPITVHDPAAPLSLVYVDDVVGAIIDLIEVPRPGAGFCTVGPIYDTTVGEVAELIRRFHVDRQQALIESVGTGLTRCLYATYVASLPPAEFSYALTPHVDARGAFAEVLKTRTSGQFSYFTAHPGVTRGGHYHHTKTEKFLVVQGQALFRFRHMLTGETHEIRTSSANPEVVETVPGWTHDITNVGSDALISLLWANEIFEPQRPDTIPEPV